LPDQSFFFAVAIRKKAKTGHTVPGVSREGKMLG
jgi:hypothetical protein